jgi:hypothetical protein
LVAPAATVAVVEPGFMVSTMAMVVMAGMEQMVCPDALVAKEG